MGNLCGKLCGSADSDNFSGPGRVVGAAPSPQAPRRASVPSSHVVGGPPRALRGATEPTAATTGEPDEARRRAAEAAEARAKAASRPAGKLGSQLQAQKKQTQQATLQEASRNELRARDADEAAQARSHH